MKALVDLNQILDNNSFKVFKDIETYPNSSVRGRCIRIQFTPGAIDYRMKQLYNKGLIARVKRGKYKSIVKYAYAPNGYPKDLIALISRYERKWNAIKMAITKRMHCFNVWELMKIREFEDTQKLINNFRFQTEDDNDISDIIIDV